MPSIPTSKIYLNTIYEQSSPHSKVNIQHNGMTALGSVTVLDNWLLTWWFHQCTSWDLDYDKDYDIHLWHIKGNSCLPLLNLDILIIFQTYSRFIFPLNRHPYLSLLVTGQTKLFVVTICFEILLSPHDAWYPGVTY